MTLLLDTHALAWWFQDSDRLSGTAREAIASGEDEVLVSVVSAYGAHLSRVVVSTSSTPGSPAASTSRTVIRSTGC